jgi:hypothetical protein
MEGSNQHIVSDVILEMMIKIAYPVHVDYSMQKRILFYIICKAYLCVEKQQHT